MLAIYSIVYLAALPKRLDPFISRGVGAFGQRTLPREVTDDLTRGFPADKGSEFFNARFGNFVNRSEVTQQSRFSFLAHAGNCGQFGSEVAQLATFAMIGDSVAVRLVADHLNQAKY